MITFRIPASRRFVPFRTVLHFLLLLLILLATAGCRAACVQLQE